MPYSPGCLKNLSKDEAACDLSEKYMQLLQNINDHWPDLVLQNIPLLGCGYSSALQIKDEALKSRQMFQIDIFEKPLGYEFGCVRVKFPVHESNTLLIHSSNP